MCVYAKYALNLEILRDWWLYDAKKVASVALVAALCRFQIHYQEY